jgi:GTPase SAR1 family protein
MQWIAEVKHHRPDLPFILVGTKSDLRGTAEAEGKFETTTAQGKELADKLGAWGYAESSATDERSVGELFPACRG